jgi:hypothetical protein
MSVVVVILLTFITCGVYAPIWFLQRRAFLNALDSSEKKISDGLVISALVAWSISLVITLVAIVAILGEFDEGFWAWSSPMDGIDRLISFAGGIMLLMLSFRAKNRIAQHMLRMGHHVPMSGLATFLLQIYYLQYKINQLPEQVDVAHHFD